MLPCGWRVDYRSCRRHWDICVDEKLLGIIAEEAGSFGELMDLLAGGIICGMFADCI
jgi:hypothetical protein